MRMKKRFFSMLLCIVLCLSLMPTFAFATVTVSYDLWVGGTQVTNDNKNDIFGNGTVSFNTDTNTLTLNNATLTESYEYEPYYESVIYSALPSLTVNLTGTNEIAPTSTYSDGIDAAGGCNITVTGNGTLNITNGYYGFYVGSYDVPGGNLTIDGATLNVSGTLAAGIWVNHDISFTDSTVRVIVTNDFYTGLVSNIDGTITVTNSDIQVSAIKAAIHMGNTDESDHSLVLNSGALTLNSNNGYGIWTEPDVYSSVNGTITINGGRLNVISALGVSNIPMSNLTVAEGWGFTTGSSLTDSNVTISPACYTIVGYKNEGPDGAIAEVKINGETVQEHTNTSGTLKISTGAQDVSVEVKFNHGYTFGQCADGVILRWGGVQSGSTNINSSTVSNSINMPNSASLENGSGDRELYLIIQTQSLPEFDVNVQTDGNGTASANPTSAAKGDTVTLTAVPNEGYHFKEWQSSDVTVSGNSFTMPEKNVLVKAIFEADALLLTPIVKIEITVPKPIAGKTGDEVGKVPTLQTIPANAFEMKDGNWWNVTDGNYFTGTFEAGKSYFFGINIAPKAGYRFECDGDDYLGEIIVNGGTFAYTESSGNSVFLCTTVKCEDSSTPESYTVTFNTNGGSAISSVSGTYGNVVDLDKYVPSKDGFNFGGWYSDSALTTPVDEIKLTGNMTVYAKWVEKTTAFPFTDVKATGWSYNDIYYVWKNGLMQGTSETTFAPKMDTSRAMIVTILWRLEGEPVSHYVMSFDDVVNGKWYTEAIRWAQENGVVYGYSEKKFGTNDPITREQMASILYRYADFKGYDVSAKANLTKFEDSGKIGGWAVNSLAWANANNLISGVTATKLDPQGKATREQVAAILHRFCENIVK